MQRRARFRCKHQSRDDDARDRLGRIDGRDRRADDPAKPFGDEDQGRQRQQQRHNMVGYRVSAAGAVAAVSGLSGDILEKPAMPHGLDGEEYAIQREDQDRHHGRLPV